MVIHCGRCSLPQPLLSWEPPPCPLLPLMTQGHPHRCPGADGQTLSATGPCFRAPCTQRSAWSSAVKAAAPPDEAWPLSWPSGQKQPDASQLHRPRTCASACPASSELRGLISVMENSEKQGRQSPNSKWGATSMHKAGLVRVKDEEQALSVLVHARNCHVPFPSFSLCFHPRPCSGVNEK